MMKALAVLILLNISFYTLACSTFIAGREATEDGSIIVARTADGPNLEFVFQCQFNKKLTEPREFIPCEKFGDKFHYTIPSSMSYFSFPHVGTKEGQNFSFEENGINEKGISMSATETILSSKQMLYADPLVSKGLNEDCITSVILPQINSARDGAKMLGDMINVYGSSEGFGVAFADENECWYLENAGGRHWMAQKIPDNCYFFSANHGRLKGSSDITRDDILASPDIVEFAV